MSLKIRKQLTFNSTHAQNGFINKMYKNTQNNVVKRTADFCRLNQRLGQTFCIVSKVNLSQIQNTCVA